MKKLGRYIFAMTAIAAATSAHALDIDQLLADRKAKIENAEAATPTRVITPQVSTRTLPSQSATFRGVREAEARGGSTNDNNAPVIELPTADNQAAIDLFVAENGFPTIESTSPGGSEDTIIINFEGAPVPVEMTFNELAYLQAKKERIAQYLYEQQELTESRALLRESQRAEKFELFKDQSIPLTVRELTELREAKRAEQIAMNTPLRPMNHNIRAIDINVDDPNPITVFVAPGLASSLVFFDSTGAPWPITGEVIGDSTAYTSQVITENRNIAVFNILRPFTSTNALLTLEGLSAPVVIRLVSNGQDNDDRLSVRVPRPGPLAEEALYFEQQFENQKAPLVDFLNKKSLEGGQTYQIDGVDADVSIRDGKMYIRTATQLVSPSWDSQLKSTTGLNVYEMAPTNRLLFSENGRLFEAEVKELDLFDIQYNKFPKRTLR